MIKSGVFFGLQPSWFTWDRLYKVYVIPGKLVGAYLAGQVYDEPSGNLQMVLPAGFFGLLMVPWVQRLVRKRNERETYYDSLAPDSPEFLAADRRNFLLDRGDVERIIVKRKRAIWTGGITNSGSIQLELWGGKRRRFILVNEQNVDEIVQALIACLGKDRVECDESGTELD